MHFLKKVLSANTLPSLERANSEVLTAKDSSIGSSGGITDVKINVHSKNNLYLFLSGSSLPKNFVTSSVC